MAYLLLSDEIRMRAIALFNCKIQAIAPGASNINASLRALKIFPEDYLSNNTEFKVLLKALTPSGTL